MNVRNITLYRSRLHNTGNAFNNLTTQILLRIYYINYIYTYVHYYYPLKLQMRSIVRKETMKLAFPNLCSAESSVPYVTLSGSVRKIMMKEMCPAPVTYNSSFTRIQLVPCSAVHAVSGRNFQGR